MTPTPPQPTQATSMKTLSKSRKRSSNIVPDTFEKVVEFPADGPGRVIVRLERLMGSDKVRLTDTRYMALLLKRLEEEERQTWNKRTRERRKAEHIRFRQLVIDGHADPGVGMQDLYKHPVFRINRILQRLSRLGTNLEAHAKLPPIHPIDPFEEDDTGGVFKSYPGHLSLRNGGDDNLTKFLQQIGYIQRDNFGNEYEEDEDVPVVGDMLMNERMERMSIERYAESDHSLFSRGYDRQDEDEFGDASPRALKFREIQKKYGVAPNTDLAIEWEPYRSHLVDKIFSNEDDGVWALYENSDNIADVYDRQLMVTEEYISAMRGGKTEAFFESRKKEMKKYLASVGQVNDEDEEVDENEDRNRNEEMVSRESPPKRASEGEKSNSEA
ncbi:unnamed protein product [Orchesella dallaii]|uniref:Uncharacterized protein n=1 Tax=Orchesella dallaii TaxID=48710 RepID=A0ABP1QU50_9HEXA